MNPTSFGFHATFEEGSLRLLREDSIRVPEGPSKAFTNLFIRVLQGACQASKSSKEIYTALRVFVSGFFATPTVETCLRPKLFKETPTS